MGKLPEIFSIHAGHTPIILLIFAGLHDRLILQCIILIILQNRFKEF